MAEQAQPQQRLKLGLFGGSFDPVHLGHLALARVARDQLGLDQVLWLPAGQPWQKLGQRAMTAAVHRQAMVALTIAGEAGMLLDTRELLRAGPSYTVDTAEALARQHPGAELLLIIGQDQLGRLHSWQRWQDLLGLVRLAVVARDGQEVRASAEVLADVPALPIERLAMPAVPISSTLVRAAASRGEDLTPMVGKKVAGYIAQHRLYSEY
ncbi:nicotinate-nucleotide adenylyltransferase [Paucibacter sp. APW11]|uniref:Probable nicotinate-nucleotide adenylyltransferase n=1 Tax=Roseateles aquae TaxID=3077235 RepID=A0ABU3PBS5_9BURK|nr:nicotinate-nucleotide adenylyltransferase [Paucibacter sp. APW11]MDT8999266.1 nicotinate-nucleotide adenylyltransferase [Paucibacter sp. APW11]